MPHVSGELKGSCTGRGQEEYVCSVVTEHVCMLWGSYYVPGKTRSLISQHVKENLNRIILV